jgi:type I restriction enzyme M protein
VLSNKKAAQRKGKVQLINGVHLFSKMRKSLGSKRKEMGEEDIKRITRTYGAFEVVDNLELDKPAEVKSNRGRQSENGNGNGNGGPKTFSSKIFKSHAFGYRRITIERPLRMSYQFIDERIEALRFASKPLSAPMKWLYEEYGQGWTDEQYGDLKAWEKDIRIYIKKEFSGLKEKQIKDLLNRKTWLQQKETLEKARLLQQKIGTDQHNNMNGYDAALKAAGVRLDAKEKKQITAAVSWKNPDAEKMIKKVHRKGSANPTYGIFNVNGKLIEYQTDGDLRDHENVPLDPSRSVNEVNEAYFAKEVQPHVPEAWIDGSKRDGQDGEVGIVGYEIPFNRHFYVYQPPRDLAEIDADLDKVSAEIMQLLQEVRS